MATVERKSAGQNPVHVKRYPIRLGQFLKLGDIVSDGIEAKQLISGGHVAVNNEPELKRGRKLVKGDTVTVGTGHYICV